MVHLKDKWKNERKQGSINQIIREYDVNDNEVKEVREYVKVFLFMKMNELNIVGDFSLKKSNSDSIFEVLSSSL